MLIHSDIAQLKKYLHNYWNDLLSIHKVMQFVLTLW